MHSTDWRTWPGAAAATAAYSYEPATLAGEPPREPLLADQLARWLFRDAPRVPTLDDMASVFGLSFDAEGADVPETPPERLLFTAAVLRDAFPDDGAVRRWLRTPDPERDGQRPLDLLLVGRAGELETLAVREWNRRAHGP